MATNMTQPGALALPVQQVATAQQLGPFIRTYQSNLTRTVLSSIFFFACGVFFLIGAFAGSVMILLVFALLCIAVAIYMLSMVIRVAKQQIHLFQGGIIVENRNGVQPLPWSQVNEVLQSITRNRSNGIYVGTTYVYTLRRADGYQIKLDNLTRNIAELGPIVAKGVTQVMVPRALYSLNTGQTLNFGPLTINAQSINKNQKSLPWTQVKAVEVKAGFVTVKEVGTGKSWGLFEVAKIPNFFVFTVVADEMQRRAREGK